MHDDTTDIKAVRVTSEECAPKLRETTNGSRSEVSYGSVFTSRVFMSWVFNLFSSKVNNVRHGPFKKKGFVSVYVHVILSDNTE